MTQWRRYQYLVSQCLTEGRYLTKWEEDFLEKLNDSLACSEQLTPEEVMMLEQIHAERVP